MSNEGIGKTHGVIHIGYMIGVAAERQGGFVYHSVNLFLRSRFLLYDKGVIIMDKKETQAKTQAAETTEMSAVETKLAALQQHVKDAGIGGVEFETVGDNARLMRSFFQIKGQQMPMFVVINDTVYTTIQIYVLQDVAEDKEAKLLGYLNRLNTQFSMLKYVINGDRQLVLQCSVPAGNNHFDPALITALIEEVQKHLVDTYDELMKAYWQE